ncbi:hypothetical protein CWO84_16905 [Methylomonas sp. Kb3]|uniref:DUF6625 family protein n=1 Tax=Methylomonas sp. Kb3 TaxID=1611544 RepID=UPI000C34BFF7|nr:DUF6625 family protein [Methylomonas sp. Kb3]PKD39390.1 hypothetical protein CWO84_16905 [Methylomonas sp. Kb3]
MKMIVANIYFGKCPAYFDLFVRSCGYNSKIDFLFLVDFEVNFKLPPNVKVVKISFQEVRESFQRHFDFPLALDSPYKLTDFQPAYGELLAEYFNGYDWWGHCDFDMVFGDLNPLLVEAASGDYVKIFRRGHMTLYKNTAKINSIYREGQGLLDFRRIFSIKQFCNFDETNGIDAIFASLELPVFRGELIADIAPRSAFLHMTSHPNHWGQYFIWLQGKLHCFSNDGCSREFVYIHLQKRAMVEAYKDLDVPLGIIICQFGFFENRSSLMVSLLKICCFLPNFSHLKRFFWPRLLSRLTGRR